MPNIKRIGIICEDTSDFESIETLIKRITGNNKVKCIRRSKDGCSHIISKGPKWAEELHQQGCQLLLVVHDLDRNTYSELSETLRIKFKHASITNKLISIPVEEIEAWMLTDPGAIASFFRLTRVPKIVGDTATISDPKKLIERQVRICSSSRRTVYVNTKHNPKLAAKISIDAAKRKSVSFKKFYDFVSSYTYAL